jgi:hypothetical protein
MASFKYTDESASRILDYARNKQPAKVVSQTPAPGTPVLEGMTIEIHAVSDSDVPFSVLDIKAPLLVKNIPLADMEKIIVSDDDLRKAVTAGDVSDPELTAKFNRALNRNGVNGALSTDETLNLVKSLNGLGFGI